MPEKDGVKPVSKVMLQPMPAGVLNRDKILLTGKSDADFQLNSLGGPLEEDFTG